MQTRMKTTAIAAVPGLRCLIGALGEYGLRIPIGNRTRQILAPLEQQDTSARRCKLVGERCSTGPAADDDQIVVTVSHGLRPRTGAGRRTQRTALCFEERCDCIGVILAREKRSGVAQSIIRRYSG